MTPEEILLSDEFMDKFVAKFIEKAFPSRIEALGPVEDPYATIDINCIINNDLSLTDAQLNRSLAAYVEREKFTCKVCGNVPDETGLLEHGRGCFVVSEDGGGTEWIHMGCDHDRLKVCPACQSGELKETDK